MSCSGWGLHSSATTDTLDSKREKGLFHLILTGAKGGERVLKAHWCARVHKVKEHILVWRNGHGLVCAELTELCLAKAHNLIVLIA